MSRTLHHVAKEAGITVEDLTGWIERRWVLPIRTGGDLAFDEVDRARIRMILEFHRDLAIDDEAMPVVLDLLDRLHAVHAQLRSVLEGITELPESEQISILRHIQGEAK